MEEIRIGVLTISDRCSRGEAADESGENLVKMIQEGIIRNGNVVEVALVPDDTRDIQDVIRKWCDDELNLILTTGGTGLSERDVTPEATMSELEKTVPGIQALVFKVCYEITSLACLSRGVAGVKKKSLIINLPGSKKASQECLEAVASVIPHAVEIILGKKPEVETLHRSLSKKKSSLVVGDVTERDRESPYPCVKVTEAWEIIKSRVLLLKKEKTIDCKHAFDFVLAQDVIAKDYLPPFDASLKDGYAVLSTDQLENRRVIGVSNPGSLTDVNVREGFCVRVSTGAAIPPGADAVVPVEYTKLIEKSENNKEEEKISITKFPEKNSDIRFKGSDFSKGQLILPYASLLDVSALGLLAAVNVTSVRVFAKPLVAVFSTGDELLSPGEKLRPGKVLDSNRSVLINLLKKEWFEAVDLGICPDHPDSLVDFLERGFEAADVVVSTGNVSMGERDYIKRVLVTDFGADILFGRVWLKPGKPTSLALVTFKGKEKIWLGLPGNPASTFVTANLFLLPTLRCISGQKNIFPSTVEAVLNKDFHNSDERPNYVRGNLSYSMGKWTVSLNEKQQSSSIWGCVDANCLILFPGSQMTRQNSIVTALLIGVMGFFPASYSTPVFPQPSARWEEEIDEFDDYS